ncbi:MAG TPA: filamentous hemagglutinin N-terminal domain-containing protein, partial [Noviherbaspirillum sp.]|nr:filamentous hemagglutinin N-terminal domain-containing protein [Noviherbaspirillum sp.]
MKTKDAMRYMRNESAMPENAALRRRLLPLLIAACFSGTALANPAGPQVVNGQVGFAQQGSTLSITNTPGAIINWQSFSINPGELTRFIQQHPGSAVLNRIVGQDPSQILGALQSNGRVFLVNPNGILFGAGAQVDVNGLVASTLNISNQDFLLGKMHFAAGDKAAALKNQGAITTPAGGQVYLIAPNVENSGIITSPKGEVLLAAGHTVQLVDSMNPDLHVVLSAPDNEALNLGQVIAQGGKTGIYGALIKQRGIVNANSAVVGENGKIVFKASKDSLLEAGSVTTATGEGKGGEIHVLGERVGLTGDAMIDASGKQGGGTVLVGGDYQGKNADIRNAKATYAGMDTAIKADALDSGEGGKVIVWADETTRSYGHISARGGAQGGNGGFVETSGKFLDMQGSVDTRAPKGTVGTLLLDPTDIYIAIDETSAGMGPLDTSAEGGEPNFAASGTVSDSLLTVNTLQNALGNGSVKVTTINGSGGGSGIINVVDGITWGNGSILSLEAEGGIIVNGAISNSAGGTLGLRTTSGDITQSATISVPSLFAYADTGSVVLNNPGNSVTKLAGWAGSTGTGFSFNNAGGLTIGMVSTALGTSNGIATYNNKPISLTAGGALNIENTIDSNGGNTAITAAGNVTFTAAGKIFTDNGQLALSSSLPEGSISLVSGAQISTGNGLASLKADKMSLVGTVSAGTNTVELMPYTPGKFINLGSVGDGTNSTLELSATELSQVTAGTLRIGDTASGNLQI